jgi:hypothetical protein
MDWWTELPAWLRMLIGLVILIAGIAIFACCMTGVFPGGDNLLSRSSIGLMAVGFVLVVFGGKSSSEKNGYHF